MRSFRRALGVASVLTLAAPAALAAGVDYGTLEELPAAQADDRLAALGVPASDIAADLALLEQARRDPAAEIVGDTIQWPGQEAVLTFVTPMALADCASGGTCLWENTSYTGAMLRFTATGTAIDLANYGWVNRASSWANKRAADAQLGTPGPNWSTATKLCLQANSQAASMGAWDNAADMIRLSTSASTC
jgi:hypothetical protein